MDDVTLKEHIESRLVSLEKATSLASANMEKRLETMNEFRGQLKDQANTFITRTEYNLVREKIEVDIRYIREALAEARGKATQKSVSIGYVLTAITFIIAVVSLVNNLVK